MAIPEGYSLLARVGFVDRGNYSASATYLAGDVVYYNGSTWSALKDNLKGVTPTNGANWRYMARGFASEVLSAITAKDTSGLVGTAGASVGAQELMDAIADKVATKLLLKTDLVSQIVNDATKAASMAALYAVKQQLDQQNSDFTSYINTVGKTSWSGIETITTVASTWKQCTKSITLDPGTYIFVGHACAPAGDNAGTIRIDNIDAVESYQYFGPNTALRKVNVSLFWNITKRTTFTLSVWCSASGVSVIDCEVSAIRLK